MLVLICALFFLVGCLAGAVFSLACRIYHLTKLVEDIVDIIAPDDDGDPPGGEAAPVPQHIRLVKSA